MEDTPQLAPLRRRPRRAIARQVRLCMKELREILRDRRTIVTLVLMPLLVYPLLSMVFQKVLLTNLSPNAKVACLIGVDSPQTAQLLDELVTHGDRILTAREAPVARETPDRENEHALGGGALADEPSVRVHVGGDLRRQLRDGKIDLAIIPQRRKKSLEGVRRPIRWTLLYREGSSLSNAALEYVERRLRIVNETDAMVRLAQRGDTRPPLAKFHREGVKADGLSGVSIATLAPLILILMTITGAVYPAIDLTAGERERGTLEMLVAAPIPRLQLLFAKYIAVLTVALLTATVNMAAMTITLTASGLSEIVFGQQGVTLAVISPVFALMVLFAAFFSAILLTLTSFARSFKEAQAYLIPIMLIALAPGVMSMMPGLEFGGVLAVTPLVNIVLLTRDVLQGDVNPVTASVAVLSTALYALASLALAARIFGADAILYGSEASWTDLFRRPGEVRPVSSVASALFCLAALFPCYFLGSSFLAQLGGASLAVRLGGGAAVTALLFGGFPWLFCRVGRVASATGLRLRGANWAFFAAAIVLGATLWPLAHELFLFNAWLGLPTLDVAQMEAAQKTLEQFRGVPLVLILTTLAITPAVFEELFFRGYLQSSFLAATKPRLAILYAALLFGLFHVFVSNALAIERFLPSTFLGLVLGWVCYRSGSVWPGMLLHACHNSLMLSMGYYQDYLEAWGWNLEGQDGHLPKTWIAAACLGAFVGGLLVLLGSRLASSNRVAKKTRHELSSGEA